MKIAEVLNRLTGFSTPIFGVSWEPSQNDVTVARRVVSFLEDRRVLYQAHDREFSEHVVQSVQEIRVFLTKELGDRQTDDNLTEHLREMRAACRQFLNAIHEPEIDNLRLRRPRLHYAGPLHERSLRQFRSLFGIHVGQLAVEHGLDLEDELSTILPRKVNGPEVRRKS